MSARDSITTGKKKWPVTTKFLPQNRLIPDLGTKFAQYAGARVLNLALLPLSVHA